MIDELRFMIWKTEGESGPAGQSYLARQGDPRSLLEMAPRVLGTWHVVVWIFGARTRVSYTNKPNLPGGTGRDGARGTGDMGTTTQNKANLQRTGYPSIPLFYHSNPILIVQNKPNLPGRLRPRRAKRAKRTQFPERIM
jgi:hypothetical protein